MNKFYKNPIMMLIVVLFSSLVIATIYRIMTAIDTNPGLVAENPYMIGKEYGSILNSAQVNIDEGWAVRIDMPDKINHTLKQQYKVAITKNDIKIDNAKVTLYFYRPLEQRQDFKQEMMESAEYGFVAEVKLPLKGRWDIIAEGKIGEKILRIGKKIFAK